MKGLGRPVGSVDTRRRTGKPPEASRFAGIDFSIPEQEDHANHVKAVRQALRLGFPVLNTRPA